MSRSTLAKSRAEKGKATSTTPAVAHEIIPGKYTDQEWNAVLDQDDSDDLASDIVRDICSSALDIIYQNYIQKQLVPYTVLQAKDAILQIIQWQFLSTDDGEECIEEDLGWKEDEEPDPAVTDCWAQGSVPRTMITQRQTVIKEEEAKDLDESVTAAEEQNDTGVNPATMDHHGTQEITSGLQTEDITPRETFENTEYADPKVPEISQKKQATTRKKFRPHNGRLKSAGVGQLTESLEDTENLLSSQELRRDGPLENEAVDPNSLAMPASCQSMLKLQAGRPPGNREVLFDEKGNVLSVTKIDPTKLPSHRVRTLYRVVDPAVEAAQARLQAMRTGRYVKSAARLVPQPPTSPRSTVPLKSVLLTHATHPAAPSVDVNPLPPPLIEAMDVALGVVVREGDRVKRGPRQPEHRAELIAVATKNGLRPIGSRSAVPSMAVAEILEHRTPVVRPLIDNTPIPPIQSAISGQ